ncbi:Uncharacterised protein [Achromobacter spanius]|uniref:hypothetical protein n=1 Tax=Achromobacter spanius TaxID=217203 RepID=UPI000C2B9BE8|nr:hypothetical protein [Achromobacter spanius]AUA55807.1 hypothetical protein CVS48_07020 [Achromobacter spanius]CAB3638608.1 hypothetical protein LMG5911_01490 [Achromobacter spanius]SPT36732.1 Uncharacterised protein [Achromobacter denitrificans]VEE56681.1 Uncharacterised protein [Achromobacter spanius]
MMTTPSITFVLGPAPWRDARDGFADTSCFYTDSIETEAALAQAGVTSRYLYRDCDVIFDSAATAALSWLATLPERARASASGFTTLFDADTPSLWNLCHDSLFEIRGGIFESILHLFLVRQISRNHPGATINILAPQGHAIAAALAQLPGVRLNPVWTSHEAAPQPLRPPGKLAGIWRRLDTLVIAKGLMTLRRIIEGRRPNKRRLALFCSLGDMTKTFIGKDGKQFISDVYYDHIEAEIRAEFPDYVKTGLHPARAGGGALAQQLHAWRAILTGQYRPWYTYARFADMRAIWRARRDFQARFATWDTEPAFQALFSTDGMEFYPLVRAALAELMPSLLAAGALHSAIAQRFVARERIGRVLAVESFSNLGRSLALAVHQAGGELWGVQGGIITPQRVTNAGFYLPALESDTRLIPDRFFVWGPGYRDTLLRYALPAQRLDIMGFNRSADLPQTDRASPPRILYLTGANALVCPYLMTVEEEAFTLRALARHLPRGADLVVRTHPRHVPEDYERMLEGLPNVRVVSGTQTELATELAQAAVIVGKASTVLLEAANANRPVLLINLAGTPEFTGFSIATPPLPYVTRPDQIERALQALLDAPPDQFHSASREFSNQWCAGDGPSAARYLVQQMKARPL